MLPLNQSVARMKAADDAGDTEGIDFAFNASTDAYLRGADREPRELLEAAVERGRAWLEVGAKRILVWTKPWRRHSRPGLGGDWVWPVFLSTRGCNGSPQPPWLMPPLYS